MSLRPYTRGTSILAALVFVAILGGVALGVSALSPATPASQTAEAANAAPTGAAQKPANPVAQKCAAAIAAQKTSGKDASAKTGQTVNDDCVAAIKTNDPAYKATGGFRCTGKSAQIMMNTSGTMSINWQANPNVEPGTCKTVVCQPVSQPTDLIAGASTKAKCTTAALQGITKSSALDALNGPGSFFATRDVIGGLTGNDSLTASTPLDQTQQDILNQALGKDPNSTDGKIALNSNGDLASPSVAQLQKLAADNPDATAQQSSLALNQDVCSSNPALCPAAEKADLTPAPTNPDAPHYVQQVDENGQNVWCDQYGNCSKTKPTGSESVTPGTDQPGVSQVCKQSGSCVGPDGKPIPKDTFVKQPPSVPVPPPGNTPNPGPGAGQGSGGLGGLEGMLGNLLKGFSQGLAKSAAQANAPACPSDPNAYSQAQQQYNMQLQQYNLQLQQYNMQSQYAQMNGYPPPPPPQPPVACQPNGSSNTCMAQPPQPTSACQGTWTPIRTQQSNGASCTTGWQCVPTSATPPTAQISCQPLVADVGMSIAISYTCGNADGSAGLGFDTANAISGSTSTVITTPPQGTNTATFGVQCRHQGLTANAQCSIQVGRASIVLVATPRTVAPQASSTIGWVTSGMQSCVISSPTLSDFTTRNATNTSVSGAAITPPLATTTDFVLGCTTVGGSARQATTTVVVSATSTSN